VIPPENGAFGEVVMVVSQSNACPYCAQQLSPAGEGVHCCPKCKHTLVPATDPLTKTFEAWMPADLGRYQVIAVVGGGGMGRIFRGKDKQTGGVVAVKFPAGKQDWDQNTCRRFEREIGILQTLSHPNIVRYLATGTEAGYSYYIMEWVEGDDIGKVLAHCRKQKQSLPFDYVHKCFQQLCQALQALHDQKIIHRDVKPANIIVTADETIKLITLGIAKLQGMQTTAATRMTGALGTDAYLAPEQLFNPQMVDHRADIFATGQVIYEMLTGFLPKGNVRMSDFIKK
jgi:serine/threonine protein kinase